jgi:transcriptional regulator with XRE-family HTH domain
MDMDAIAERVREERKRRGWTQEELAKRADIKLGAMSNFERRKSNLQPGNLRSVMRVLGLEDEAGDSQARQTREEWPPDVRTFLDVMGVFLSDLPDERRLRLIHDLTRQIVLERP